MQERDKKYGGVKKKMSFKKISIFSILFISAFCFLFSFDVSAKGRGKVYITGVTPVENMTVPALATLEDVISQLPKTTTITVSKGDPIEVELDWTLKEYVEAGRGEPRLIKQTWLPWTYGDYDFVGAFELPDGVYQRKGKEIPLKVETSVYLTPRDRIDWSFSGLKIEGFPEILKRGFDQPGTYASGTIGVNGAERSYHYYVPSSYDGTKPVPLVFDFHGAGSYGIAQALHSDFHRVAEEGGFISVWSDGIDNRHGVEDVPYISALIDKMAEEYNIDLRRVYATGMSNGSGMAMTLAFELPERIAAVGIVSSASTNSVFSQYMEEGKTLRKPMPFLLSVGTQDAPYYPSNETIYTMLNYFQQLNQIEPDPEITKWAKTDEDPTSVTRSIWRGGKYGSEVRFYRVENGGHTWPGSYQYASTRSIGYVSQHINQTEELWDFFKRHQLPIEISIDVAPKVINPKSKGVIKVTIPSTGDFDATSVKPETVRFGPDGAKPMRYHILGNKSMILHFRIQDTGIETGDTEVELTGNSSENGTFHSTEKIRTVR